ncbi:MAG: hypothetical protein RLY71_2184 [Pseudomonadota bacterium]|jgi:hypothetical protein
MPQTLSREHRKLLENTVARAREAAEAGAAKALQALGVGTAKAPAHLDNAQTLLRVALRAHGRQIGNTLAADGSQAVDHLITEVAYEHWHRMLFARFLSESDLLFHPDGYPVTLADCKEEAPLLMPPARSEWEVAGRYASAMLPNVFRPGSPTLVLQLPLEAEQQLEAEVGALPAEVFAADDSLGWSYQFWQAPRKAQVQKAMKQAGTKVGADELPAVTQLFTEPYMVAFLLENSLGAWWTTRFPGRPLPVAMPYFRTTDDGQPAAGDMPGWPKGEHGQPASLASFKLLDPCLGSGHFLVAVLHYLVPLRRAAEGLSTREAVDRVLAENLHGLELDPRCVEIAAFALALAAWRYVGDDGQPLGHRQLPRLNIACCGVAPRARRSQWLALAGGDSRLEAGMAALYELFQQAPELGSLIDPSTVARGGLFDARWDELAGLLEAALSAEGDGSEAGAEQREAAIAAQGMAVAVRLLSQRYQLVVTNPPYLKLAEHGSVLRSFCEDNYPNAIGDIANIFLERSLRMTTNSGAVQFVMPQNWLFLVTYKNHRKHLLECAEINSLVQLGSGAFETINGEVVKAILFSITNQKPRGEAGIYGGDISDQKGVSAKAASLRQNHFLSIPQSEQYLKQDSMIGFNAIDESDLFAYFATCYQGTSTGDNDRYTRNTWEFSGLPAGHEYFQGPAKNTLEYEGREIVANWDGINIAKGAAIRGREAWGHGGVSIGQSNLAASIYCGNYFSNSTPVIIPNRAADLAAIWLYVSSPEFESDLRRINQKRSVDNGYVGKISLDFSRWRVEAEEQFPNGLPKPYSDDPTQWIFHGHPKPATDPLQVALARLLGYRWPAERDAEMELSDEARALVKRCAELDALSDDDGIACLPSVRGEPTLENRLRALLAKAFGAEWSAAREAQLLAEAGSPGLPLSQWLRDKAFEQHVQRFHKRPFLWHIWDGHKDGFSAFVNYHQLTRAKLQTLTQTYLGDWITQLRHAIDAGGADAGDARLKLAKAEVLKTQLEAILEGEAPYDIFVRWKPLHQQPLGWEPDLNDGVRMNIRPFVEAGVLRIPRNKLGIKWEADRGKDVPSAPWFKLGPQYGEAEGTRINDHHTSLAEKRAARASFTSTKE